MEFTGQVRMHLQCRMLLRHDCTASGGNGKWVSCCLNDVWPFYRPSQRMMDLARDAEEAADDLPPSEVIKWAIRVRERATAAL